MTISHWLLLGVGVLLSSLGSIFLKLGSSRIVYEGGLASALLQILGSWQLCVGVFLYVIPVLIWIYLLKRVDISVLQPLFSLVYVVTPVLAIGILNEHVPAGRWAGIAVVCLGVAIIARH